MEEAKAEAKEAGEDFDEEEWEREWEVSSSALRCDARAPATLRIDTCLHSEQKER